MSVPGWASNTVTLTGTGTSASIPIFSPSYIARATSPIGYLQPSVGVGVTGTVTTTIQYTNADYTAPGYSDATANWYPFTGLATLSASATAAIGAAMTRIRINTASGTGTVTLDVCQQAA